MSKILYLAPSKHGKTASLRNLNPKTTRIINSDKKELPLEGWRANYVTVYDKDGKIDLDSSNYIETDNAYHVLKILQAWEKIPSVETMVHDTITHMITRDYMNNAIGKDFKGYQQMGKNFDAVFDTVRNSKKNVVVMGHIEKIITETGEVVIKMRSQGRMIDNLEPPSYFTTVLMGEVHYEKDQPAKYLVRTQSLGNDPAGSPARFKGDRAITALELYEPNDIAMILRKLNDFEYGT